MAEKKREVEKFIEGLQIIDNARLPDQGYYHLRAEHDEIIAGSLAWPVSLEDRERLEELGWTPVEHYDGWQFAL